MRGEGTSLEAHWWKLVEDFVTQFNKYRTQIFSPLDIICADDFTSRRYGQGGNWINLGFPMYVEMDRKPENGAETPNSGCGRSGIMMRPRIVKSTKNEEEQQYDRENLPHGTKILKELVIPWDNTDRIVCSGSYFESVSATEELWKHGLRFIGIIKTAMRIFPMVYLYNIEFHNRRDMSVFLTRPVDRTKLALGASVYMDRNRR